ncbi:hypothetical protein FRB90_002071 [Tulasnella sp. 427]|nr:hypothetical protein FRB90_002071 [Tulasnella sp. 427]
MRQETVTCACKARFIVDTSGYSNHIAKCSKYRIKQASSSKSLLGVFERRKKRQAERKRLQNQSADLTQDQAIEEEIPNVNITALQGLYSAPPTQHTTGVQGGGCRPRRSAVARRLPTRLQHLLPESRSVLAPRQPLANQSDSVTGTASHMETPENDSIDEAPIQSTSVFQTLRNAFGVFRSYLKRPARIPDQEIALDELTDGTQQSSHPPGLSINDQPKLASTANPARLPEGNGGDRNDDISQAVYPFPNISTFRLAHWYHTSGASGSRASLSKLVNEVLRSGDFELEHLDKQSMEKLDRLLDEMDENGSGSKRPEDDVAQGSSWDGWKEEAVRIQVPTGVKANRRPKGEDASRAFNVKGLHRRGLVDVIKSTFESQAAADFHFDPFTSQWETPSWMPCLDEGSDNPTTLRILDELYTSDAWIEEQTRIEALPDIPDDLPRAIAGMMFGLMQHT